MTTGLLKEVNQAIRTAIRKPGFGAAAVGVLAIGIAAVSTMFSTLSSVVLRPLPFDRPDELTWVFSSSQQSPRNTSSASDYSNFPRVTNLISCAGSDRSL